MKRKAMVITHVLLSVSAAALAGTYWVSPNGTATWANAKSSSPLNGTACAPMAAANSNALAGDTVYVRGGTYNTAINPSNSGSGVDKRITYGAYAGEIPVITNVGIAVSISGKRYIKLHGITVKAPFERSLLINKGASYNELSNCTFNGVGSVTQSPQIWDGDIAGGTPCTHNWIHGCTFANTGYVDSTCDDEGGFQLGVPSYDDHSGNTTFENNVWYGGGHHNLETFTPFNVIRDNFFHHEGSMPNPGGCPYGPDINGLYGNRNIQIFDGSSRPGTYNLIEGNRFGTCGPPPDDDGGDGFTLAAPANIVRYNDIFNGQNNGILLKIHPDSRSDNNRIYNNTIWKNGRYKNVGPQWQGYGIRYYSSQNPAVKNVIVNNIVYNNASGDVIHTVKGGVDTKTANTFENNWLNADGDPLFADTDLSDWKSPKLPNLSLQPGSKARDRGTHVTLANGAGSNSTTLTVDDALYFQDGSWGSSLSNIQADWIAIAAAGNVVKIKSIDYSTNTITLVSSITWSDDAKIWLYKDSKGTIVLHGAAPDMGAHEYRAITPINGTSHNPQNPRYTIHLYSVQGKTVIFFNGDSRTPATGSVLRIYNLFGRLVDELKLQHDKFTWNTSSVSKGPYIMRLEGTAVHPHQKLLIIR